jgi:hypothetical protein
MTTAFAWLLFAFRKKIADVAMNLALAMANPIQIRNEFTRLFAKTGKPKSGARDGQPRKLMTPRQFVIALKKLGMTPGSLRAADALGVTVRQNLRYASGES